MNDQLIFATAKVSHHAIVSHLISDPKLPLTEYDSGTDPVGGVSLKQRILFPYSGLPPLAALILAPLEKTNSYAVRLHDVQYEPCISLAVKESLLNCFPARGSLRVFCNIETASG